MAKAAIKVIKTIEDLENKKNLFLIHISPIASNSIVSSYFIAHQTTCLQLRF